MSRKQLDQYDNPELATLLSFEPRDKIQFLFDQYDRVGNFKGKLLLTTLPCGLLNEFVEGYYKKEYDMANNVRNFDVFVFELCDGNISRETKKDSSGSKITSRTKKFTLIQSVDICKQLLEGLQQLEVGCPRPGIGQKCRTFCNVAQFFRL